MEENREKNKEDNLIPYKKGTSGNKNGRPKGQRNYKTIYREALEKIAEQNNTSLEDLEDKVVQKAIAKALKGDFKFYQDIMDRLHGKPLQKNELSGNMVVQFADAFNKNANTTQTTGEDNSE